MRFWLCPATFLFVGIGLADLIGWLLTQ